ncbi:Uncharacterized protein GBIM_01122, partial [Gryllus bimaculatus]
MLRLRGAKPKFGEARCDKAGPRRAEGQPLGGEEGEEGEGAEVKFNEKLEKLFELVACVAVSPLSVRLVGANRPLTARVAHEVQCQAVGGRPPPHLAWRKAGLPLMGARQSTSGDGNVTTSVLTWTPSADDQAQELECVANASRRLSAALRDAWLLEVRYPPEVSLDLGANLNASFIREGDDVYFDCSVRANPWIHKVVWKHKVRWPLHSNASVGVILSNQTLVLQSVRNHSSGLYACIASNAEGEGESEPFHLNVKRAGVPSAPAARVRRGAPGDAAGVVRGGRQPARRRSSAGSFNSSAVAPREVTAVASAAAAAAPSPPTRRAPRRDYGTLLCWGRNALGAQAQPCVFHVVPAGRPEARAACALRNRTWSALQVACARRGFDGGRRSRFSARGVRCRRGRRSGQAPRRQRHGALGPKFTVAGLEPGAAY